MNDDDAGGGAGSGDTVIRVDDDPSPTHSAWLAAYALGLAISRDDDHGCIDDLAEAAAGRLELIARARADLRRLDRGDRDGYRRAVRLLDGTRTRITQAQAGRRLTSVS